MNFKPNKSLLGLTVAGFLAAMPLHAALVAYTPGDLLMSFRATGGTGSGTTYVVNIGQASSYRDVSAYGVLDGHGGTVNLAGIGTDLVSIFGTGWQARNDVFWGVVGTPSTSATVAGDEPPTLYASKAQTTPGVPGSGWVLSGSSFRANVATTIFTAQDAFDGYQATANSPRAIIQQAGEANDMSEFLYGAPTANIAYTDGSRDFGGFSNIEGNASQSLSLFRITSGAAGSFEGTFSINSSGQVTFIPEPSSALLGVLGAGLIAFRRRRRNA